MAHGRRRDDILAAARSEFARHGFAGARVERIAKVANVNKQLIFHYFKSKYGLYLAAVSASFATWKPVSDGAAPPSEHLRHVTAHLVQWLGENPGVARAIAEAERAPGELDVNAPPTEVWRWLEDAKRVVRSAVEAGQRQGYFRDDIDPQAVAEIVASSAVGHVLTASLAYGTSPSEPARLSANLSQALVEYCAWR